MESFFMGKISKSKLEEAAPLRFESPVEFGKPVIQVASSFICLKCGLRSQALHAQLEEAKSWNTLAGLGSWQDPLLCRALCCDRAY